MKIPGSGAAGGVGAGAVAFCNANIKSGIDEIMRLLDLENLINKSDLVITGEGKLDKQTLEGKVVKGVINLCKKFNKPLGIVCGDVDLSEKELKQLFPSIIKSIKVNGITAEDAVKNAKYYLTKRANELISDYSKY
ncbi:MAG: glycerate kinase [Ignavibacteriales bacterium]|nr:glycerate kinase [Ignavibacteriales bacterium]